jgi:hypothetical protein
MVVMSLAASALGTIYREVSDQVAPACPCGWEPNLRADIEALRAGLAATSQAVRSTDLQAMQAVGRA